MESAVKRMKMGKAADIDEISMKLIPRMEQNYGRIMMEEERKVIK